MREIIRMTLSVAIRHQAIATYFWTVPSRHRLQNNLPIAIPQLQHNRIVYLNRMLFAVNADDEIYRRRLFHNCFDRRWLRYDDLRDIGGLPPSGWSRHTPRVRGATRHTTPPGGLSTIPP